MLRKFYLYTCFLALFGVGFAYYRNSLIETGYEKAVAEYQKEAMAIVKKHDKEVSALLLKTQELQNANKDKSNELNDYRSKFSAVSERLRDQQDYNARRVEEASCGSVREYANVVNSNFAEARGHIERLGLEAASCSATAETLKNALDLANGQGLEAAY